MDEEKTLWQGSPSQLINLPVFLVCALAIGALPGISAVLLIRHAVSLVAGLAIAGLAVVPLLIALGKWLSVRSRRYELTTERLLMSQGVLSRSSQNLELYRVRDYVLSEPWCLRLFGLGDIQLASNDESNPTVVLTAVPGARALRDQIRQQVEQCRDKKRVRVSELE
jgi:membrane protein YdbS with pleckstrin-like domain